MSKKINYYIEGDFLIPNLVPPPEPNIGIWGRRRKWYLQHYKDPVYTGMLLSGVLNTHLEEVDRHAEELLQQLIEQLTEKDRTTAQLKAINQMGWVGRMNNIRSQAEEIVNQELIYA